jgi:predicted enzyme related to lactoylglutathione lyase
MNLEGITWHAIVLEPEPFAATKALMTETFGLAPAMEMEGVAVFNMPNGTLLELYEPQAVPDYGYNDAIAFGFRVDDIEAASAAVEAAGCELLGQITRVEEMGYAYRHFRGPDGRVYGLNEQK